VNLERQLADYGKHLRQAIGDLEVSIEPGHAVRPVPKEELVKQRWLWTAAAAAVAAGVIVLAVLLWPGGGSESAPFVDDGSTVPGTTLTVPTTTTLPTTTTAALPGIEGFAVSVDDAGLGTVGLVAVSAGEVWAVRGVGQPGLIGRLEGGVWTHWRLDPNPRGQVNGVAVAPDGTVWVATNSGVFSFDGVEWTRRFDDPAGSVGVDGGGIVWIGGPQRNVAQSPWLARWDGEAWVRVDPTPQAAPEPSIISLAILSDGGIWVSQSAGGWGFDLLMRYDGTTMEEVRIWDYLDHFPGVFTEIAVAPNGDLLVGGHQDGQDRQVRVARFDGDEWTEWAAHDWPFFAESMGAFDMAVGSDGVLWFAFDGGLASVDGTEWTTQIEGPGVSAVDVAPDGTVWYAGPDGVHIFSTP
jgi:hypothetical protein